MKLIVVKSVCPEIAAPGKGVAASLVWLDRLCNGLISRAAFHKSFDFGQGEHEMILLAPANGPVDRALVWVHKEAFPWKQLKDLGWHTQGELYWSGEFAESEIIQGTKLFPTLAKWQGTSSHA